MFDASEMKRNCELNILCHGCKYWYMCKSLSHIYELSLAYPWLWSDEDCEFIDEFVLAMRDLSEVGIDSVDFEWLVKKFNL